MVPVVFQNALDFLLHLPDSLSPALSVRVPAILLAAALGAFLAAGYLAYRWAGDAELYRDLYRRAGAALEEERRRRAEAEERAREAEREAARLASCSEAIQEADREWREAFRWAEWARAREMAREMVQDVLEEERERLRRWAEEEAERLAYKHIRKFLRKGTDPLVWRVFETAFKNMDYIAKKALEDWRIRLADMIGQTVTIGGERYLIVPKSLWIAAKELDIAGVVNVAVNGVDRLRSFTYASRLVRGRYGVYDAWHLSGVSALLQIAPGVYLAKVGREFRLLKGPPTYLFRAYVEGGEAREGAFLFPVDIWLDYSRLDAEADAFIQKIAEFNQLHKERDGSAASDREYSKEMS
ncbi:MAG: hypothetical protein ACP5I3_11370 [Thermoproteus sp.]